MACRIEILGGLRVLLPDRTVTRFRTRKTALLLGYLACFPRSPHPREALIARFWPELDFPAARNNLSKALTSLRRELEPPGVPAGSVLRTDRATVALGPAGVAIDLSEMEAAVGEAKRRVAASDRIVPLVRAVELDRGPLLQGYHENWVLDQQQHVAALALRALEDLLACLEAAGEPRRAIDYARRGREWDPLREKLRRALMRLLAAAGDPEAALREYRDLARCLRGELDADPEPATRALAARIAARSANDLQQAARDAGCGVVRSAELPLPHTRFFGREEELARLRDLLLADGAPRRLVTLTGPGGSGKTRLAQEAVRQMAREQGERQILFVSLADLAAANLLPAAVGDAPPAALAGAECSPEDLIALLSRQPTLLVLDNFEHLVEEGAPLVRLLLERAASLTCLVTSRCCLNLEGEQELPLAPLPVPPAAAVPSAECRAPSGGSGSQHPAPLLSYPSVALFLDRARAVRPDFQLTEENAAAVAALCRGLEGIPLAIELAAARARVLSPVQMVAQLERRFDLLVSRRRDTVARHRTLREAIDWSVRLLSPDEQRFFARLSVFRGGWTAEAAAAVCGEAWSVAGGQWSAAPEPTTDHRPPTTPWDVLDEVLDLLTHLREASLLLVEPGDDAVRYHMLDTLREYGRERLSPDEESALGRHHAAYFLKLIRVIETHLNGPEQKRWLDRLEQEHDNIRAALAWSQAAPEGAERGLEIVAAIASFWVVRGHWREARPWCETVLANPRALQPTPARAGALRAGATIAWQQGDAARARSWLEESIAISRERNQLRELAYDKLQLGHLLADDGEGDAALAAWRESERFFREQDDRRGIALAVNSVGAYLEMAGDEAAAPPLWEESGALFRELGHLEGISWCLDWEARVAAREGDLTRARALLEEALAIRRELGHPRDLAVSLRRLARLSRQLGDPAAARALCEEALAIYRELGAARFAGAVLEQIIEIAMLQGDPAAAERYREERAALASRTP